jgi:hypothetical protein
MATKYWKSTSSTDFTLAANWSDAAAPANGDTLILNHLGTASIETNLGSVLTGITLIVEKSYLGRIGVLTSTTQTYLTFDGGTISIGTPPAQGSPNGSSLIMIGNTSTTAMTVNVLDSASTGYSLNYPPVLVKGTDLTVNVTGGRVGIAALVGDTAAGTFKLTKGAGSESPFIYFGSGATPTAISASAGAVNSRSSNTCGSAVISGTASYTYDGTGAHTALTVRDTATCYYSGTGTITTASVSGGTLDFSRDTRAKTVTNSTVYSGSRLNVDNGVAGGITFTNATQFPDGLDDVTITSPGGVKAKIEAI